MALLERVKQSSCGIIWQLREILEWKSDFLYCSIKCLHGNFHVLTLSSWRFSSHRVGFIIYDGIKKIVSKGFESVPSHLKRFITLRISLWLQNPFPLLYKSCRLSLLFRRETSGGHDVCKTMRARIMMAPSSHLNDSYKFQLQTRLLVVDYVLSQIQIPFKHFCFPQQRRN